ncbi:MAG: hypothetical protein Q9226_009455, partial [Calogaya cf. arnoldii]
AISSETASSASPSIPPANATDTPQRPSEDGLSKASRAGIGVGIAVAVIVACGLLYMFYRRRRARQTHSINDESAVDHREPGDVEPQVTETKEGGRPLDPPPAYPYEKATRNHNVAGTPGSAPDTPGNSWSQHQSYIPNVESSDRSNAGFYAQSLKRERSHQPQHEPDIISYHNRPEIDGNPLHEAPESSKKYKELGIDDINSSKPSSQSPVNEAPDYVDLDHLSKLEQEERQLQEDIAQIERLERLKVERDS